jgi:hypothetical protein
LKIEKTFDQTIATSKGMCLLFDPGFSLSAIKTGDLLTTKLKIAKLSLNFSCENGKESCFSA